MMAAWRPLVCAPLLLVAMAGPARAVDVSQLSDFSANPCFIKLSDRNTAQQVDAPASALVDACERAHDNPEVAWDFLTRTWQPREITAAATYRSATTVGAVTVLLALLEMILIYALLGAPVWALVAALWPARGRLAVRSGHVATETVLAVVTRLLIGTLLLALTLVPGAPLLVGMLVLLRLSWHNRTRSAALPGPGDGGALARILADTINDTIAALPGLLALALTARGNWPLLAVGVLAALPVSLPAAIRARLALGDLKPVQALGAALLALGMGALAVADPALQGVVASTGSALAYLVPLIFAAIVLWRSRIVEVLRHGRWRVTSG